MLVDQPNNFRMLGESPPHGAAQAPRVTVGLRLVRRSLLCRPDNEEGSGNSAVKEKVDFVDHLVTFTYS